MQFDLPSELTLSRCVGGCQMSLSYGAYLDQTITEKEGYVLFPTVCKKAPHVDLMLYTDG